MPDSTGRNDSGEKSANSPLVRGSAKQSRDQDGQACDEGSWPARDEAGRNSSATERNLNPDAIGLRPVDDPSFGNFPFKHPFVEADITGDDTGDEEERVLLSEGHSLGRTPREIVHNARAGMSWERRYFGCLHGYVGLGRHVPYYHALRVVSIDGLGSPRPSVLLQLNSTKDRAEDRRNLCLVVACNDSRESRVFEHEEEVRLFPGDVFWIGTRQSNRILSMTHDVGNRKTHFLVVGIAHPKMELPPDLDLKLVPHIPPYFDSIVACCTNEEAKDHVRVMGANYLYETMRRGAGWIFSLGHPIGKAPMDHGKNKSTHCTRPACMSQPASTSAGFGSQLAKSPAKAAREDSAVIDGKKQTASEMNLKCNIIDLTVSSDGESSSIDDAPIETQRDYRLRNCCDAIGLREVDDIESNEGTDVDPDFQLIFNLGDDLVVLDKGDYLGRNSSQRRSCNEPRDVRDFGRIGWYIVLGANCPCKDAMWVRSIHGIGTPHPSVLFELNSTLQRYKGRMRRVNRDLRLVVTRAEGGTRTRGKREVFTGNDGVRLHVGDVFSIMTSGDRTSKTFVVVGIRRTTMESEGPQWFEIKYLDKNKRQRKEAIDVDAEAGSEKAEPHK